MEIDYDGYTMKRFSDDFTFYWRILHDTKELEGIMVVNGTSWVGIGWRPTSLTPACRAFPELHDPTSAEPLPIPEPKSEPISEPEPETKPKRKESDDPSPEPEPEAAGSSLEPTSRQVTSSKKHDPESSAEPEPGQRGKIDSEASSEPFRTSGAKRRSAKPNFDSSAVTQRIDTDVTVQTSVTYQVSAKQGKSSTFNYIR